MSAAAPLPDRLGGAPDGKRSLRLWLRLLTCSTTIERRVSQRFRDEFGSTLPRFDMLSALDRAGVAGLLMVSNGNVTGLAARLKADGLIEPMAGADRRVQRVRLTAGGRARFAAMAAAHEHWIETLLADLTGSEADDLIRLLEQTKRSLRSAIQQEPNR